MNMKFRIFLLGLLILVIGASIYVISHRPRVLSALPQVTPTPLSASPYPSPQASVNPSLPPSPSPTPTLSPEEREALYGPCIRLPILMYHHIADTSVAQEKNFTSLNVPPATFKNQISYLKDSGYHIIPLSYLADFFQGKRTIQAKSVILTFDDAYDDFFSQAVPILTSLEAPATLFVPTGLIENPGYAKWSDLTGANKLFYFGNHTWSHHSALGDYKTELFELTTADTQLKDHNQNPDKLFAYPYGTPSKVDEQILDDLGYQLAVTTTPGSWQCAKQKYILPRIRIGNTGLKNYGF